jgi:pimeloyl-ACP methyl ester carboxylesterase
VRLGEGTPSQSFKTLRKAPPTLKPPAQRTEVQAMLTFPSPRAALLALIGALCAAPAFAQATDDTAAADEAAFIAQRYVQPTLAFTPCAGSPTLECATLPVPIDYRKPWAGVVRLAVIRAKATAPARRIGVLFANPGGPGESGLDFIKQGVNAPLFKRLRERFDIVSFDVRGSHASQPVNCQIPLPADPATVPAAQLPAYFDDFSRSIASTCLAQAGEFVTTLSTNNIARDIDVLRRSLGERQITYVGASAGTALGAVYATLFPRHVRALLLDAGLTPSFRDGRVELRSEQQVSFETSFHRVDQLCRADAACKLRDKGLLAAQDEVLARLTAQPLTSPSGRVLGAGSERAVISAMLSTESFWPVIVDALSGFLAGDPALMFQLLDFFGVGAPNGPTFSFTAFSAILCNDFGTRRSAAEVLPVSEAVSALNRRVDGRFTVAAAAARCAAWPAADVPIIRSLRGKLDTPALLLGSHFDPNTPLAWTRTLATVLGMDRHVARYQGGGHTTFIAVPCMSAIGEAYLYDLKLPEEGFSCPARPVAFTPAATATAMQALRASREGLPAQRPWGWSNAPQVQ